MTYTISVTTNVTKAQKKELKILASKNNMNLSEYIRQIIFSSDTNLAKQEIQRLHKHVLELERLLLDRNLEIGKLYNKIDFQDKIIQKNKKN